MASKETARTGYSMRADAVRTPNFRLVNQLHCKLELSARECVSDLTEVTGAEVSANAAAILVAFELRMVKGVETLRTKLHVEALREGKVLEQRQVKVVSARTANRVEPEIAIAVWASHAGRL